MSQTVFQMPVELRLRRRSLPVLTSAATAKETDGVDEFYARINGRVPDAFRRELDALRSRLSAPIFFLLSL